MDGFAGWDLGTDAQRWSAFERRPTTTRDSVNVELIFSIVDDSPFIDYGGSS